jgi:hypothetical protein
MITTTLRLAMGLGLLAGLGACGTLGNLGFIGNIGDPGARGAGLPYDARLSTGETREDFTILVRAPGATLEQARESARFEATRHCIERTGMSDVAWALDPATGDWAVARSDAGEPIVTGRCSGR